jgi:hypothetical protein
MAGSVVAAARVEQDERDEGDAQQEQRGAIGLGVAEILNLIVDGDGQGAGSAGDIAADHEDDAEFTHGVGEAKGGCGDYGTEGERQHDFGKDAEASGTEEACLLEERGVDGVKAGGERLDGEGQAVDDGADDESGERKRERMAEEVGGDASEGGSGPEQDEQVEAEDGGRKQDREGAEGFDERTEAGAGGDDPVGEGNADDQQHEGGRGGEADGEGERLEIHQGRGNGMSPLEESSRAISGRWRKVRKRRAASAFALPRTTIAPCRMGG